MAIEITSYLGLTTLQTSLGRVRVPIYGTTNSKNDLTTNNELLQSAIIAALHDEFEASIFGGSYYDSETSEFSTYSSKSPQTITDDLFEITLGDYSQTQFNGWNFTNGGRLTGYASFGQIKQIGFNTFALLRYSDGWGLITINFEDRYSYKKTAPLMSYVSCTDDSWGYAVVSSMTAVTDLDGSFYFWIQNSEYSGNEGLKEFINYIEANEPNISNDPYKEGGDSGEGGGTGDYDGTSEDIDIPDLPSLSAASTGMITLFNPTTDQIQALAEYMWNNDLFDLDTWKKIFDNPMDAIIGLSIVPVNVPSSGASDVTVGNIITTVSMNKASSQYVAVDCGTLNVNEYWGAYLDYDPYTKAEIYLPYCGTHPLKVDDIMGKSVQVVYHVDILSGACCAYVKCGGSVLYTFIGQCSASIPISGSDMTQVINGVLSIAGSVGTMIATGGASAPISISSMAATAVNNFKPSVERSGAMGGTGGMMGIQKPYIILTRPKQCLPTNQNSYMGYPSFTTKNLSALSGYTEIEAINLSGLSCTNEEKQEIETLLKSGVLL